MKVCSWKQQLKKWVNIIFHLKIKFHQVWPGLSGVSRGGIVAVHEFALGNFRNQREIRRLW